jgi:hypothetical protein
MSKYKGTEEWEVELVRSSVLTCLTQVIVNQLVDLTVSRLKRDKTDSEISPLKQR